MSSPRASRWPSAPSAAGALWLLGPPAILLVVGLLTPTESLFPHQGDVDLYRRDAAALAAGAVPYRDFDLEYPPLALVAMLVPYVLSPVGPPDLAAYKWLFIGWEAALLLLLGIVLRRLAAAAGTVGNAAVGGRLTFLTLAAALPLTWRYDLFPALLAALSVLAAARGRAGAAGVALGLGALAKLFPLVVLPALGATWLARRDGGAIARLAVMSGVAVGAGLLPFVVLAGGDALGFLGYQAARGLQIESLGGGLAMLAGSVTGSAVPLDFGFSAVHVTGLFADAWLALLPLMTVAGFGAAMWATWVAVRRGRETGQGLPVRVMIALATLWILALLVTSKVFSVQYVVWLVPFAALLPRGQLWLTAAIGALSMAVHPGTYDRLIAGDLGPILLLNLRNGLVLLLFGWVLADLLRSAGWSRLARGVAAPPAP